MDGHRPALTRAATLALPALFLALFFAYPLAAIVGRGLSSEGSVSVPGGVVWFTVWQAAASTALSLALGLPLAAVIGRYAFPGRALVRALVLVPFVLPTVVVAGAFLALGLDRGVPAILAAHVFFNVAVVVRVVGSYWARLDLRLWDGARRSAPGLRRASGT